MIKKTNIKTAMTIVTTLSLILIAGFAGCAKQEQKASGETGEILAENAEEQKQGEEQVSEQVEAMVEAQEEEPVLENKGTFDANLAVGAFDGVIRAEVDHGEVVGGIVKEVRATFYSKDRDKKDTLTVTGEYADGGFTITLPETLDVKFLDNLKHYPRWAKVITDRKANRLVFFNRIQGYNSNGHHVGDFRLNDNDSVKGVECEVNGGFREEGTEYYVEFQYVDRDVAMLGSDDSGWCDNLVLKKGWNKVYKEDWLPTDNGCYTTAPPPCNLKWRFINKVTN
jgi:hypothetical protein